MSQVTNDSMMQVLGTNGFQLGDEIFIGAAAPTVQAGAVAFKSEMMRVVKNLTAGASMIMPSLLRNEAGNLLMFLINDSTNTVNVFCAVGELMNSTLNSSFAVTAGNSAIFLGIPPTIARKGASGGGTLNWSSALLT